MILLELTGAVDASGATETFCFSKSAFTTRPTDTPPDREFKSRLTDPGAISMSIYGSIAGGSAKLDIGEIIATNIDGAFDHLKNVSFDGRELVMRVGDPGGAYPADYPAILVASMESVDVGWEQLIVKVRDPTIIFDKPVLTERFKGDNVPPNGLEGTADDLKDQLKPRLFGSVPNIAPPCVNPAKATYRVSNGPIDDISKVWIRGAEQTRSTNHPNSAALQAATVTAGTYHTCLAEGLFRIGAAAADGQVTCNAEEGGSEGRSAARLLRRLAIEAGLPESAIKAEDVAALDVLNAAPLGRWLDDETTFLELMDEVARSVGAWYGFDPTNVLRMGRLDAPRGGPVATVQKRQLVSLKRTVLQDLPTPLWSVTINHTPIGKTQDTDLVGAVTAERRAFLRNKYRSATSANEPVKTQFRLASSLTIDTLLMDAAAAEAEALRIRQLHDGPHDLFEATMLLSHAAPLIQAGAWLGRELALDVPRFDLAGGRSFVIVGIAIQRRAKMVVFRLWAPIDAPANQYADVEGYAFARATANGVAQNATGPVDVVGAADARGSASGVAEAFEPPSETTGQPVGLLFIITKRT